MKILDNLITQQLTNRNASYIKTKYLYVCNAKVKHSNIASKHRHTVRLVIEDQKKIDSTNSMIKIIQRLRTLALSISHSCEPLLQSQKKISKKIFPKCNRPTHCDFFMIPLLKFIKYIRLLSHFNGFVLINIILTIFVSSFARRLSTL